jgi:hypothetical protein
MVSPKSILQITFAVEEVGVERTQDAAVARFGGAARARCEGEGLERARVGGSHAVQNEEEELVGE